MRTLEEITVIIKQHKRLTKDSDVALLLGLKPKSFATSKNRNSIPFVELTSFCNEEDISLNWLLTGVGPKERGAVKETVPFLKSEGMTDPTVTALAKKLEAIYEEGNRKDRGEVRGLIDEIYDDLKKNEAEMDEEEPLKKTGNH